METTGGALDVSDVKILYLQIDQDLDRWDSDQRRVCDTIGCYYLI